MRYPYFTSLFLSAILASSSWANDNARIIIKDDWSGAYLGANLGGVWSRFYGPIISQPFSAGTVNYAASSQLYTANQTSFIGGGQIGYNWQIRHFLFGTEISANGMSLNKTQILKSGDIQQPWFHIFTAGDSFSSSINWQTTWVARIGRATQDWLLYALGGIALSQAEITVNRVAAQINGIAYPASSGSSSSVLIGGSVGIGAEYLLSERARIGLEYRYVGYGSHTYQTGFNAVYATSPTNFIYTRVGAHMGLYTNQVALRLNYFM